MKKVYLAIGIYKGDPFYAEILGVFRKKEDAEAVAYSMQNFSKYSFINVIEKIVQ